MPKLKSIAACFQRLGNDVEARWKSRGYRSPDFPKIAANCITDHALHEYIDAGALIRWSLEWRTLPQQLDPANRFGHPPITVFRNKKLSVSVLFWNQPDTAIHDHGFSGAFTVLQGTSLQCTYRYDRRERYKKLLSLGALKLNNASFLRRGDVQAISCGPEFIHSVWHIAHPSISLVVRTHADTPDQFTYYRELAVNYLSGIRPAEADPVIGKKMALMDYVFSTGFPGKNGFINGLISESTPFTAYLFLNKYCSIVLDREKRRAVFATARRRHGRWIDAIENVVTGGETEAVVNWRAVSEEGPRLLLSLLMTLKDRDQIRELIQSRYPDHSVESLIEKWESRIAADDSAGLAPSAHRLLQSLARTRKTGTRA